MELEKSEQILHQNTSALKEVDEEVAVVDVDNRDDECQHDENQTDIVEEAEPAINTEEREEVEEHDSEGDVEMAERIVDEGNDDCPPAEDGDEVGAQDDEDADNDDSETPPCEENNDECKQDDQPEGAAENSLHEDDGSADYDENNES